MFLYFVLSLLFDIYYKDILDFIVQPTGSADQ